MTGSKKWLYGALALCLVAAVVMFSIWNLKPVATENIELPEEITSVPSQIVFGITADSFEVVQHHIEKNQTLSQILEPYAVSMQTLDVIAKEWKHVFDISKLRVGNPYTVLHDKDSLASAHYFIYEENPVSYIVFYLKDSINVARQYKEVDTIVRTGGGEITNSLYATVLEMGGSPQLVVNLAEIFAWEIDFFKIKKHDSFKVIYEELYVDSTLVSYGRVLGALFVHEDNSYYGFRFDQDGQIDYFDENGRSLRKAFLKAPLKFSRISSGFTKRRFHPVQKIWKPHLGTDYAAPTGTPIMTIGNGEIVEAGYKKFNGNYVKVKHNNTYTTQYLHMSRIASGMRKGRRVQQGEVIGYVGRTGLATGPHLCFRFWKNGTQVNPKSVVMPPSDPVSASHKMAYDQMVAKLRTQLDATAAAKKSISQANQ